MFTANDISVYIFSWKKVSQNSAQILKNIQPYINDITVVNCDEAFQFDNSVKSIQLDDSHYFGSQYEHAIKDVRKGQIFCEIVGDNIPVNNYKQIFENAIQVFNAHKVGVYAPLDKRSWHTTRNEQLEEGVYTVDNTDCGFWFIHPEIVSKMRRFKYGKLTPLGWGIDAITMTESARLGFKMIRDYRVETDQLDHSTNYNKTKAASEMRVLFAEYEKYLSRL